VAVEEEEDMIGTGLSTEGVEMMTEGTTMTVGDIMTEARHRAMTIGDVMIVENVALMMIGKLTSLSADW
jgi:hypothetical protein